MKLPRDLSGMGLAKHLAKLEYSTTRQTGSHMRLSTDRNGAHHITIPAHDPLKFGTMNSILRDIAEHHGMTREELLQALFG